MNAGVNQKFEKVKWDSKFEIGIEQIDSEHKIFLSLINSYIDVYNKGGSESDLDRKKNQIEKYAEFHFLSEENLMHQINYPNLENHHIEHLNLLEQLNISKHLKNTPLDFLNFSIDWFVVHTTSVDKDIAIFIKQNNINLDE